MPDIRSNRETGNALTIGIVLAGIVAALILVGSVFFQSDQKSVDVTVNQPSTESPTTGRQNAIGSNPIVKRASVSVGALIFWSPAPLTERATPRPAFVTRPALFSTLFDRTMRSMSIERMEKPRPRSAGLLRFHGGTSDGRGKGRHR